MSGVHPLAAMLATLSLLAVFGRLVLAYRLNADLLTATRQESLTAVVTYLVLPMLVIEGVSVGEAFRRSREAIRTTWGENIIGQGGIVSATDALEFLIAGANCVGIGTVLFALLVGPSVGYGLRLVGAIGELIKRIPAA